MNEYNVNGPQQSGNEPGKITAIASLVCGILSIFFSFFGITAILSVLFGIAGLVLASNSKKAGFIGGMRTAGFALSIIGLVLGAIIFVACVACVGSLSCIGALA